jgi:hypothetical protein
MRIYKRSDRIVVKINDVVVKLAPLTLDQKTEIQSAMFKGMKGDLEAATQGVKLAIKYSVKAINGVVDSDNADYRLEFDSAGELADSSINDLLNMEISDTLAVVCASMTKGVPKDFKDQKGNPLDGVEVVNPSKEDKEKKP